MSVTRLAVTIILTALGALETPPVRPRLYGQVFTGSTGASTDRAWARSIVLARSRAAVMIDGRREPVI